MRKRAAWVITWNWFSSTRKPDQLILHLLQPRWAIQRVVDYMKLLYLNSQFYRVSERFSLFSEKEWRGMVRPQGPRIYVGLDPLLVASKVKDLRTERDTSTGDEIIRWTQPPSVILGPVGSRPKRSGESIERIFRISNYGATVAEFRQGEGHLSGY